MAGSSSPPQSAATVWHGRQLAVLSKAGRGASTIRVAKQVGALVDWYVPLMKHDNAELRAADLHQLAAISGTYETRAQFLMEVTLEPPEGAVGSDAPAVLG